MFKKKIFKKHIAIYCDTVAKENALLAYANHKKQGVTIVNYPKSENYKIITFEKALKKGYQWNEELGKVVSHTDKVEENKEEFTYPIFAKSIKNHHVMRFDKLDCGVTVFGEGFMMGREIDDLSPHTNTTVWQILDYDADRGLYDTQPFWCWNDHHECKREIRFYDAENTTVFTYIGHRNESPFDNYKPLTLEEIKALQPMLSEMYKELKYD